MMEWNDDGVWMNGWGMLFMIVFWAAVVALIVWVVLRLATPSRVDGPRESPRQLLDRRFASGELTPEEYVAARDLMTEKQGGASPP